MGPEQVVSVCRTFGADRVERVVSCSELRLPDHLRDAIRQLITFFDAQSVSYTWEYGSASIEMSVTGATSHLLDDHPYFDIQGVAKTMSDYLIHTLVPGV